MSFKNKMNSGQFLIGTWNQIASPEVVEIIGFNGFDFVIIDSEHGYFGYETVENLVRAAEVSNLHALVRVPANEPVAIQKALDVGAEGIVVPHISTKEDAEKAVNAIKFPPFGTRGACPRVRSGRHQVRDWETYAEIQNDRTVSILIIENLESLSNIDQILTVKGVDAIAFGAFDLSVEMGLQGDIYHPEITKLWEKLIKKSAENNVKFLGVSFHHDSDERIEQFKNFKNKGVNLAIMKSDKGILSDAFKTIIGNMEELKKEEILE